MSEETKPEELNNKPKAGIWILITIIALLLAGVLGWMYANESSAYEDCQTVNKKLQQEMTAMNEALSGYVENTTNDLKHDFQFMLDTYDKLMAKDSSKADSLQMQKDSIQKLLGMLKDNRNRSYYEINKLKKRNERLREIMDRYLVTIDSLNTLNIQLTTQLDETSSALVATTSERDSLRANYEQSTALLTKGAQLNAFNFTTEGMRYKSVGAGTRTTNRANRVEVISSTFSIGENKIAMKGDKMVYMQIIDPNGQVLFKRPNDVVNVSGVEILYSGKRQIDYQGQLLDMSIVFNLEGKELASGNYTIKIFADGALIGEDNLTLK